MCSNDVCLVYRCGKVKAYIEENIVLNSCICLYNPII